MIACLQASMTKGKPMPYTNYCKKCKSETPAVETCPHCGAKLPRTGERLSLTIRRDPVRDWFCWNAMLRVVVPVVGAVLLLAVMAEALMEGGRGVQGVFVQGFFWTLLLSLGMLLLCIGFLLLLQGRETVRYTLDGKGARACVYLKEPGRARLYARLMTPEAAAALQANAPEPLAGYQYIRSMEIPWAQVRRAGFWPETHTVLLYRPRFWLALSIRCGAADYAEIAAHVLKKIPKKKRTRKRRG